jgi:hypothetical protein
MCPLPGMIEARYAIRYRALFIISYQLRLMKRSAFYFFLLATGFSQSQVQAADISWGSATDVAAPSDVSNSGVLVEAYNLGGTTSGVDVSVNGVLFTGISTLLSQNSDDDQYSGTTADPNYDELLSSFDYGGGTNLVTLTVGGGALEVGTDYEVQVWYADSDGTGRVVPVGDGNGNTVSLSHTGQYAIGIFTADANTQALTLA